MAVTSSSLSTVEETRARLRDLSEKARKREEVLLTMLIAAWIIKVKKPFEIVRQLTGTTSYRCFLRPTGEEAAVLAIIPAGTEIEKVIASARAYDLAGFGRPPELAAIEVVCTEASISVNIVIHRSRHDTVVHANRLQPTGVIDCDKG